MGCNCKDCDCKEQLVFENSMDNTIPYTDEEFPDKILRTFPHDTPEHLLKWHWDEEDRDVYSVNKTDWKFQFDNELPQQLNSKLHIPKGVYHRIIKGSGDLQLLIYK
jgi:hypothetical protein